MLAETEALRLKRKQSERLFCKAPSVDLEFTRAVQLAGAGALIMVNIKGKIPPCAEELCTFRNLALRGSMTTTTTTTTTTKGKVYLDAEQADWVKSLEYKYNFDATHDWQPWTLDSDSRAKRTIPVVLYHTFYFAPQLLKEGTHRVLVSGGATVLLSVEGDRVYEYKRGTWVPSTTDCTEVYVIHSHLDKRCVALQ